MLISVRVQPRAGRTELIAADDGELRIRLKSPPVDGAANAELLRFVSRKILGVAPSKLCVVRGSRSRRKVISVKGLKEAEVTAAIEAALL